MAVIYLSSVDGNNSDDGSTWALAKATLVAALTAAGVGGTVYVDNAHAETQASAMALVSPGTAASPVIVICASRASGAPPTTAATTGTVSTTGASTITCTGCAYVYGLTFSAGSGASVAHFFVLQVAGTATIFWRFENCSLVLNNTAATSVFDFGETALGGHKLTELKNTNLTFGAVGQTIYISSLFDWEGGSVLGSAPTTLFLMFVMTSRLRVSGVDLSLLGSGKTLVASAAESIGSANPGTFLIENCKLGSSVVLATTPTLAKGRTVRFVNCDSADTNYRYGLFTFNGTIISESTIVRTGGASDGVTPISRKMVSTANSKFYSPLVSDPIIAWNETLGSLTATVEIVTDNVTLTDAEAWLEVEYLSTSGFPKSVFLDDRAVDILATPANQTSSSETWTTTGLATPITQKLSVTFTPAEKGVVSARVVLAKASTTLYFDPQIGLTSGREFQHGGAYMNEPATGGGAAGYSRGRVVNA